MPAHSSDASTLPARSIAAVLALALSLATAPALSARAQPAGQRVALAIRHAQPAYTPDATFTVEVAADLSQPAEYFEVRLRLTSPSGRLLYQKTEVRHQVPAGRTSISFTRGLTGLGVRQGRYPIEVRVLATGSNPTVARSRLLVLDDLARVRVPVVLVAHLAGPPATDPQGRFASDPALYPRPRSDVDRLLDVAARHSSSTVVLAAAPVLIEEWLRASDGFEVLDPGGVRAVPPEDPTAIAASATLRRLRNAVENRLVEILDVPYAEPDPAQLAAIGAIEDLAGHWAFGDAVFARSVGSSPASGTAFFGSSVPPGAMDAARARGCSFVVLPVEAVRASDTTPAPGAYPLGRGLLALAGSSALADAAHASDADTFYDALFDRAVSHEPTAPLVTLFQIGPGSKHTAADLEQALAWLDAVPWAASVSASAAAHAGTGPSVEPVQAAPRLPAYWPEVARARDLSLALMDATEGKDADAIEARRRALIAQSALWAGADGAYALAERAEAFARSASDEVRRVFDEVVIDAKDVTLPDVAGDIPVSIVNRSGKTLRLLLDARASRATVFGVPTTVTVQPGENIVALRADVRGELGDTVRITLASRRTTIASTQIAVRASYLDRIVTIGAVVLFLLALLAFIRRRARRADAATIVSDGLSDGSGSTDGW